MHEKTETDVVIVSYNSQADLPACIRSIKACPEARRITVVDNRSTDGSVAVAETESAAVVRMATNAGFGAAANEGARQGSSPLILFLNPDATVAPDTVTRLAVALQANPSVWAVGPALANSEGALEFSARGFPSAWSGLLNRRWLEWFPRSRSRELERFLMSDRDRTATFRCDWLSGAVMLVRRSVFEQLRGFDEGFFMYYEDVDLCRRALDLGYTCLYVGSARAYHRIGGSSRAVSVRAGRWRVRSLLRYRALYIPRSIVFWPATIAGIALELVMSVWPRRKGARS